jgi:hypothetical protein
MNRIGEIQYDFLYFNKLWDNIKSLYLKYIIGGEN